MLQKDWRKIRRKNAIFDEKMKRKFKRRFDKFSHFCTRFLDTRDLKKKLKYCLFLELPVCTGI